MRDSSDVLLVIEVSDDTPRQDLSVKTRLYGRAGYPVYCVVAQDAIYEHTEPTSSGYRTRSSIARVSGSRSRTPTPTSLSRA